MWNISRASYYADWVTIPILIVLAFLADLYHNSPTPLMDVLAFAAGAFVWTFIEYALHRWVFHRLYRKQHWIHHIRPGAYIGVPGWQTGGLLTVALGACWGGFGINLGGALFTGLASGYFLYIWMHDQFHHGSIIQGADTYLSRREADHRGHHAHGKEVNFGVVTPLWDVLLKTRP